MNEELKDGVAPPKLKDVSDALRVISSQPRDEISDWLSNGDDMAANYRATLTTVAKCREMLCEIETHALQFVQGRADYHRAALQSIESLQLEK